MVGRRHCTATTSDGRHCKAAPMVEGAFCFFHDQARAAEVAEARRLGGLRRRREKTITTIYDLEGLETYKGIRRVLGITLADALGLENSIGRARVLVSIATVAAKLVEPGEHEAMLDSLGASFRDIGRQRRDPSDLDDADLEEPDP